jgi:ssDNA-binding replication factor A large subunit
MPVQNFTITDGQTTFSHLNIDFSKLFTGIELNIPQNLSISTVDDNSGAVAVKIAQNIPLMFSYDK